MRPFLLPALLLASAVASAQSYTYDDAGRLARVTYTDGTTISYTYDAAGNLTTQSTTPTPPSSSSSSSGCFIATAAYGSVLDPHVATLRAFRDETLLAHPFGVAFVDFYVETSPPIAAVIAEHEWLRFLTRWMLAPIVYAVVYPVPASAVALALLYLAYRRFRARRGATVRA